MTLERATNEWPRQKLDDFMSMLQAEAHVAKENEGTGGQAASDTTQRAYEQMQQASQERGG